MTISGQPNGDMQMQSQPAEPKLRPAPDGDPNGPVPTATCTVCNCVPGKEFEDRFVKAVPLSVEGVGRRFGDVEGIGVELTHGERRSA